MVDRYTKAVLTLIAAALVAIAAQNAVHPSRAGYDQRLAICDANGGPCAAVIQHGQYANGQPMFAVVTSTAYSQN